MTRERNSGLGASDAPVALGLSPWRSPFELWLEKVGRGAAFEETLPTRVGKALEPVIVTLFMQKTGLIVSDAQRQIVDPVNPWRWVTVDGIVEDGSLLEAKAISWTPDEWGAPGTDQIPMPYLVQTQHGLGCSGLKQAYVPVLFEAKRFEVYLVPRDEAIIAKITEQELAFWQRVLDNNPPPVISSNDSKLMYARDTGSTVIADPETVGRVETLKTMRLALEAATQQADQVQAEVMAYIGESAVLAGPDGSTLATWRTGKGRSYIDAEGLRRKHPRIAKQFTKTAADSRRFLLK